MTRATEVAAAKKVPSAVRSWCKWFDEFKAAGYAYDRREAVLRAYFRKEYGI